MDTKNSIDIKQYNSIRFVIPFFVANGFIYGLHAIYYSFIPIYLEQVCKLDEFQRGIILSIGPLIAIPALIFFGMMSDKAKYKNNVLAFIIAVSAILFYAVSFSTTFAYLIVIFAFVMFFLSPNSSILDAISLEYTTATRVKYGPIRIMGSLVFGVISLTLTFFTQFNINIIFISFIVMAAVSIGSVKMMPPIRGHARESTKISAKSFKEFFSDKTVVVLFLIMFIPQFSFGAYANFMPNFIISELNMPQWVWGLNTLFTIVGELIFFAKYDFFFKKFTLKQIAVSAVFVQVLRYLSYWLIPNSVGILITSLLTGSFCALFNYIAAYYINLTAKKEFRTTAITLLYAVSFYIARFISAFMGGFIANKTSFVTLMMFCAVLNTILLVFVKFVKIKQPERD